MSLSLSAISLFLWIISSSHFKTLATGQSENIECCVLLHRSPSKTVRMLEEAYEAYEKKRSLPDDGTNVKDVPRYGRPTTSTNEKIEGVCNVVRSDR